jgi:hypothetical protein
MVRLEEWRREEEEERERRREKSSDFRAILFVQLTSHILSVLAHAKIESIFIIGTQPPCIAAAVHSAVNK